MRIEVMKLIEVHKQGVLDPNTSRPVIDGYATEPESIKLNEIKSFRPWKKNSMQIARIQSEITLLYLDGDKSKEKPAQMLIAESYDSFCERTKTIRLSDEKQG